MEGSPNVEEVKRIGRELGNKETMLKVADLLQLFSNASLAPHWREFRNDLQELDMAWHGIHGWKS
jgi:hypothetical protein